MRLVPLALELMLEEEVYRGFGLRVVRALKCGRRRTSLPETVRPYWAGLRQSQTAARIDARQQESSQAARQQAGCRAAYTNGQARHEVCPCRGRGKAHTACESRPRPGGRFNGWRLGAQDWAARDAGLPLPGNPRMRYPMCWTCMTLLRGMPKVLEFIQPFLEFSPAPRL